MVVCVLKSALTRLETPNRAFFCWIKSTVLQNNFQFNPKTHCSLLKTSENASILILDNSIEMMNRTRTAFKWLNLNCKLLPSTCYSKKSIFWLLLSKNICCFQTQQTDPPPTFPSVRRSYVSNQLNLMHCFLKRCRHRLCLNLWPFHTTNTHKYFFLCFPFNLKVWPPTFSSFPIIYSEHFPWLSFSLRRKFFLYLFSVNFFLAFISLFSFFLCFSSLVAFQKDTVFSLPACFYLLSPMPHVSVLLMSRAALTENIKKTSLFFVPIIFVFKFGLFLKWNIFFIKQARKLASSRFFILECNALFSVFQCFQFFSVFSVFPVCSLSLFSPFLSFFMYTQVHSARTTRNLICSVKKWTIFFGKRATSIRELAH